MEGDNVQPAFVRILPDLKRAIRCSESETNPSEVRKHVFAGEWQLFLLTVDNDYVGFAITETVTSLQGDWINVAFAHSDVKDATRYGMKRIEEMAQALGYRGVKVFSSRRGMRRLLEGMNYKSRFVEYVKEF